jgi:hypothetical protein
LLSCARENNCNAVFREVKQAMPFNRSSCRGREVDLLRLELENLYAQRSAIDAAILALQCVTGKAEATHTRTADQAARELKTRPCNLTNCRSA